MKTYIKVLKDEGIYLSIDSKSGYKALKKGDLITVIDENIYLNDVMLVEFDKISLEHFHKSIKSPNINNDKNKKYKIYTEQEYRDLKINTILDENIH